MRVLLSELGAVPVVAHALDADQVANAERDGIVDQLAPRARGVTSGGR
jgi:hypothetical protein